MGHIKDCMICGEELVYYQDEIELSCAICKGKFKSNVSCKDNHFVCDECHGKDGIDYAYEYCLNSDEDNALELFYQLINAPTVNLHGPEHHVIIPSVLLAAYCNKTGEKEDKKEMLERAYDRGKEVPGGTCGNYGVCGGAIGVGIFFSIMEDSSPLKKEEWGIANGATGRVLSKMGEIGGPRCCKRNGFLSILIVNDLVKEEYGVDLLEGNDKPVCKFKHLNTKTCLKMECPFFLNK